MFCEHCTPPIIATLSETKGKQTNGDGDEVTGGSKLQTTRFEMQIENGEEKLRVSTPRIDAAFGMTFVKISPTHPLADKVSVAISPFTQEKIPLFVDETLTGEEAIMGIPAHDERDFVFAKKHHIPITYVVGKSF